MLLYLRAYVPQAVFIRWTQMRHSALIIYVRPDLLMMTPPACARVTCVIHIWALTCTYVGHDIFICEAWFHHTYVGRIYIHTQIDSECTCMRMHARARKRTNTKTNKHENANTHTHTRTRTHTHTHTHMHTHTHTRTQKAQRSANKSPHR